MRVLTVRPRTQPVEAGDRRDRRIEELEQRLERKDVHIEALKAEVIRHAPEFVAVFAEIERDVTAQRQRPASRPPNSPLTLATTD
jgi:hypothetical protein